MRSRCKTCHNAENRRRRAAGLDGGPCKTPLANPPAFKACTKCKSIKPLCEFYESKQSRDGRASHCADCIRETCRENGRKRADVRRARSRERYWSDPEKARASAIEYRINNPEKVRESQRRSYQRNRDKRLAESKARSKSKSPDERVKDVERARRWAVANPERVRANKRVVKARRRARLAGNLCLDITEAQIHERFSVFGNCCAYCGASENLTADHVIPIALGGPHILANIRPACRSCNFSKGATPLAEWLSRRRSNTSTGTSTNP